MSAYTPSVGEVRDSLAYLNKHHAKQFGDVDLMVVGAQTVAQFDRMIAEIERAAAEKAWGEGAMAQWRLGQSRLVSDIPANPHRKTKEEHDD